MTSAEAGIRALRVAALLAFAEAERLRIRGEVEVATGLDVIAENLLDLAKLAGSQGTTDTRGDADEVLSRRCS